MYPTIFKVEYFNEFEEKNMFETGVTFARTFAEAASIIEKYYGKDLISLYLYPMEENNLLIFKSPKEWEKQINDF